MKKYLNILIDAINKKNDLLESIKEIVDTQEKMIMEPDFSLDDYNRLMEKKASIIADMDKLDDGFTAVYARISLQLKENPIEYADQVKILQDSIGVATDKITLIQAKELRIKNMIERLLQAQIPQKGVAPSKSDVASKYKQVMTKNTIQPRSIFMDKKN